MRNKPEQCSQMLELVALWQVCGTSQKDYCALHKVPYHVFHYWYRVYRTNKSDTGTFIPLHVKHAHNKEVITVTGINGIKIQIPLTPNSVVLIKQLLIA